MATLFEAVVRLVATKPLGCAQMLLASPVLQNLCFI